MAAEVQQPQKEQGIGLGLLRGLAVTLRTMTKRAVTVQYPHVKPDLPARTRGVIALKEANCTVCYKCSRECPDWCIYIDAHKETHEPAGGGRARSAKILDRFAIDFALCMYCGICVEVCPFDARVRVRRVRHQRDGARARSPRGVDLHGQATPAPRGGRRSATRGNCVVTAQEYAFVVVAVVGSLAAIAVVTARNVVHAALYLVISLASVGVTFLLVGAEFVGWTQILIYVGAIVILFLFGLMLTKAPIGRDTLDHQWQNRIVGGVVALLMFLGLASLVLRVWPIGTTPDSQPVLGSTAAVGESLFHDYVLPFEVVSFLLLAALIGAIVLARKDDGGPA
jgi:NADH:ubiquinone oxidoreductase subunit 6 (subunit J)/formate hydrogenlyase subunit 6/NADH:ubiquinone oxidoreductase subunit I